VSEPALTHLQISSIATSSRASSALRTTSSPARSASPTCRRSSGQVRERHGRFPAADPSRVDIWDRDGHGVFVSDLRATDPDVNGNAIITFEALRLMERAYQQGTIYAIVLVSPRHRADTATVP